QTGGRGRRGRSWEAPPASSLLVSVVLCPSVAPAPSPSGPLSGAPAHLVTVASALAAAEACADVAGFAPGLKWPNDLVVGERKLGGVLAEIPLPGLAVVGLGLNVRWPGPMPAHLQPIVVTAESVAGSPLDTRELLDAYLVRLETRCGDPADAAAVVAMMRDYRRRCVTLGRDVRIELPGARFWTGAATEVHDDGSLQVTGDAGSRRITAGDVVHLRGG
ncbi:MAG: biotin--[acetyl-CoA-carboxylase] ligase, partial [Actinobacteria bacterium]|nr:biotin--[acetyl-CoA-carboxylase] ligase [Actinomycetota bacterium]